MFLKVDRYERTVNSTREEKEENSSVVFLLFVVFVFVFVLNKHRVFTKFTVDKTLANLDQNLAIVTVLARKNIVGAPIHEARQINSFLSHFYPINL